jgi:hypothetical protein
MYRTYSEAGDYLDDKGNDVNMLECVSSMSPQGVLNEGWTEYKTIDEALAAFKLTRKTDVKVVLSVNASQLELMSKLLNGSGVVSKDAVDLVQAVNTNLDNIKKGGGGSVR